MRKPITAARPADQHASTLVNRNVTIGGRRTSMRLEPAMWEALGEICQRENLTPHELCANIDKFRHASGLTAAIRVFIVNYFRAAATEAGHAGISHGALYKAHAVQSKGVTVAPSGQGPGQYMLWEIVR